MSDSHRCGQGLGNHRTIMDIFFHDINGAGDKVNVLPVLRLLHAQGHTVYTKATPTSIYENTGILDYEDGTTVDAIIPMYFEEEETVPAALVVGRVKGIDLSGQFGQGLAFDDEELEFIDMKRALEYINVFPYTNVKQKTLDPNLARELVEFLLGKGLRVHTSPAIFDNNKYPWADVFKGTHLNAMYPYFDRRWMLDIAGARLNICIDGGPFNVSLATGTKTLGLLSVADERLCQLYPKEQWRVSQSTIKCSPCFKCVHVETPGMIHGCESPVKSCGDVFDMKDVFKKIEELL
jgi:hypothetical protein